MELEFTFYFLSFGQWLVLALLCAVSIIPAMRILRRTGCRQWWAVFFIIPLVNLIALWIFAYTRWPAVEPSQKA